MGVSHCGDGGQVDGVAVDGAELGVSLGLAGFGVAVCLNARLLHVFHH